MEYEKPTTEKELLSTLNSIYKYYRLRKDPYPEPDLPLINLQEISYQKMTDEEIESYAKELLLGEHQKEILERKESLIKEIKEKQSLIEQYSLDLQEKQNDIKEDYEEKIKSLESDCEKNGLIKSNVLMRSKAKLFAERDEKIKELTIVAEEEINKLKSEISSLERQVDGVEEYFANTHQSQISSKTAELKQKQFEFMVEVLKYNNSVQEKNVKYANYIENAKANLQIKYIEIRTTPYTKEDLIDLGYYSEVIDCISEYYKRFDDSTVYSEFSACPKLMLYLEDYYETMCTYYKMIDLKS